MATAKIKQKRVCHKCGSPSKFFYKEWWCGHTKDLKGVCNKGETK